jgi:hypothetical protein
VPSGERQRDGFSADEFGWIGGVVSTKKKKAKKKTPPRKKNGQFKKE